MGDEGARLRESLEEPAGSLQERFALMLHDRIVQIEQELRLLRPPLDPRIRLLGTRTESECGAVFVRLLTAHRTDVDAWSARVLGRLAAGDDTRFDLRTCQHIGLAADRPYVVECLVERSGGQPLAVARVAHAALDAETDAGAAVEAGAVVAPAWVAESIRVAGAAGGRAVLRSWDPVAGACTAQDISNQHETCARSPTEMAAWTMLHGWMASQVEHVDLWHPHAPPSLRAGADLVREMGRGLGRMLAGHQAQPWHHP